MSCEYLPDRVKVGPLDYKINWQPEEWEIGQHLFGQCVPDCCEINISQRLIRPGSVMGYRLACTFAHEVAHALAALNGCYEQADSEELADLASYSFVQFWRDNPAVFEWWSSLVKGGLEKPMVMV